jgi:hypothetical protein
MVEGRVVMRADDRWCVLQEAVTKTGGRLGTLRRGSVV